MRQPASSKYYHQARRNIWTRVNNDYSPLDDHINTQPPALLDIDFPHHTATKKHPFFKFFDLQGDFFTATKGTCFAHCVRKYLFIRRGIASQLKKNTKKCCF